MNIIIKITPWNGKKVDTRNIGEYEREAWLKKWHLDVIRDQYLKKMWAGLRCKKLTFYYAPRLLSL
jgi:hypothetical protein